jgi:hypothetical protein
MPKAVAQTNLRLVSSNPERRFSRPRLPEFYMYDPDYDPETYYGMSKEDALKVIGPLTNAWAVYSFAPIGEVSGEFMRMRAAGLLREVGLATLGQRRTESGTEYLVRAR